ncbi:hypothetical protein BJ508DRAFT_332334 [Ascobolus immersus RN42]|uniref:Uncharacterized protein n=1 Tax=Ascobolus immersus RN42 TaxID=1160509 RepID=A0A3N4HN24_ASCIM|nr:hypothetical protein BJ508DRAFT_332334 [Ascobolus immersus RN42]
MPPKRQVIPEPDENNITTPSTLVGPSDSRANKYLRKSRTSRRPIAEPPPQPSPDQFLQPTARRLFSQGSSQRRREGSGIKSAETSPYVLGNNNGRAHGEMSSGRLAGLQDHGNSVQGTHNLPPAPFIPNTPTPFGFRATMQISTPNIANTPSAISTSAQYTPSRQNPNRYSALRDEAIEMAGMNANDEYDLPMRPATNEEEIANLEEIDQINPAHFNIATPEPSSDIPADEPRTPPESPARTPNRSPSRQPTVTEPEDEEMVDATDPAASTPTDPLPLGSPNSDKDMDMEEPSPTSGQTPNPAPPDKPPSPPPPDPPPAPPAVDLQGKDVTKTQAATYTWKHKHSISDQVYQELIDMQTQLWYEVRELPASATTLKTYASCIPTQSIKTETVRVAVSKGFSNSKKPWATMYRFSVKDTIHRMLSNKEVVDQSHFGPRVEPCDKKATEVHHGSLVGSSVLCCPSLYPLRTRTSYTNEPLDSGEVKGDFIMPGKYYKMKIKDPLNSGAAIDFDVRVTQVFLKEPPATKRQQKNGKQGGKKKTPARENRDEGPANEDTRRYPMLRKYADKDLSVKIQPVLTNTKQLPLFGIARDDDRFNFEEEDEHGGKTAYILDHEYDTTISRLLALSSIRVDRTKHNLDDIEVLPNVFDTDKKKKKKKPKQQKQQKPSKKTNARGRVRKQPESSRTSRTTRSQTRSPTPTASQNSDTGEDSGSGTEGSATAGGGSDEEQGYDFNEGVPEAEELSEFPIVTDEPIDVTGSHVIRYIITPEDTSRWDHEMFMRPPRVRGGLGPAELHEESRSLRRQNQRLAKKYRETKLKVRFERLVHAGHLRETLAEIEFRNGEFTWEDLQASQDGLQPPRVGVSVDFYVDKFGVFRTTHRSAGGIYTTLLNLNFHGRDQPRNHACQGFLPNGCEFHNGGKAILKEYASLAKGEEMDINGVKCIVHVKLLSMSCDMAEANGIAGVKGSSANTCCRFCFASKLQTGDESFFHKKKWTKLVMARNLHLVERFRREWIEPRRPIVMIHGPEFDPYIQIPVDIAHCEQKGIGMVAIKNMMEKVFSEVGKQEFTKAFTSHPLPTNVSKIVNPAYHSKRLLMHQVSTLISCMPFILRRMDLSKGVFQTSIFEHFQNTYPERLGGWDSETIMDFLIEAHLVFAKSSWFVFKRELTIPKDYNSIEASLFESRRLLMEFYQPLEKTDALYRRSKTGKEFLVDRRGGTVRHLPNFHQADHMKDTALRYGTLLNVSCSVGELVHKLFKQLVPHTNYLDLERSFMKYWALMDALRFIIDCLPQHKWHYHLLQLRTQVPSLMSGYFFGQIARFSDDGDWAQNRNGLASRLAFMKEDRFPELYFGAQLDGRKVNQLNYPMNLAHLGPDDPTITGLTFAYESYGFPKGSVILTASFIAYTPEGKKKFLPKLTWWASISFFDTIRESRQRLRRGDVITIDEAADSAEGFAESYAKVLGICTHSFRGTNYVFLYIEWLIKKGRDNENTSDNSQSNNRRHLTHPPRRVEPPTSNGRIEDSESESSSSEEDEGETQQRHESIGMGELEV